MGNGEFEVDVGNEMEMFGEDAGGEMVVDVVAEGWGDLEVYPG